VNVITTDGRRVPVEISSTALEEHGHVVGVFGLAHVEGPEERAVKPERTEELTARQYEILQLLGEGRSTREIADRLVLSQETVRNHIREILRRLGVHSRIAAVAEARQRGLL
jgi:DNA-binding NarL/FixJ family response regulator